MSADNCVCGCSCEHPENCAHGCTIQTPDDGGEHGGSVYGRNDGYSGIYANRKWELA